MRDDDDGRCPWAVPIHGGAPAPVAARHIPRGVTVAALLVLAGAGTGAWAVTWSGDETDAVVLTRPVRRGELIETTDLAVARVSAAGTAVRLVSPQVARRALVGRQALLDLPAGTLVTPEMAGSALPPAGSARVGLRLAPEALPSPQVQPGDWVQVVIPDEISGAPAVVADAVRVAAVLPVDDDGSSSTGSAGSAGGEMVVHLDAPEDVAARIAAAAAQSPQQLRLLGVRR
ncbi:SAF domain-containing protein [Parafrankia sp. EUN1f]|uniref:SAF domain-containing protein n=1 Tax=Parafrankia sp. EUN1f TaxID=102897 RepID=UPI0001C45FE2|nr:SAF domain-containing protein [Parafrankia sp. EUN1f]EFC81310.1 SAF domain protein [Parafrankia sp. EUN1f]